MIRNICVSFLLLLPLFSSGFVTPSSRSLSTRSIARSPEAAVPPLNIFGKKDEAPMADAADPECVPAEEQNPMSKIKELGVAGAISLFLWEGAFWAIGGGGAIAAYLAANGHFPTSKEEWAVAGGEAFAFANVARLFLPARIALAIATAPWVDDNIVKKLFPKDDEECLVPDE